MSRVTIDDIVGKVQQRVGLTPDFFLITDWINQALRDEIVPYCDWSWRRKQGEFLYHIPYTTGTVTIERGTNIATFSGATLTQSMTGRQLRAAGDNTPIRTIRRIVGSVAELDTIWSAESVTAESFEIYQIYQTVPDDFSSFVSVVDLIRNIRLDYWTMTGDDVDMQDPQRTRKGDCAYYMVLRDYSSDRDGIVHDVVQVAGSDDSPVAGGSYTGVEDALFTVEIDGAGTFKWRKDTAAFTTGVAIDAEGIDQELMEGVTIAFDPAGTFTVGDTWVIRTTAEVSSGAARYEAWPHIQVDESRLFLYNAEAPDLSQPGTFIPRYVSPGLLIEKALAACARWKHPDNKYFDLKLAMLHDARALTFLTQMQREDQNRETSDVRYDKWTDLPVGAGTDYGVNRDLGFD
jgi:hypothetical protein